MLDPNHPIAKLARDDGRYQVDAYAFVFDALNHAHTKMGMGEHPLDTSATERSEDEKYLQGLGAGDDCPEASLPIDESGAPERHVTGQQLCIAIRSLALDQYGYMAKCVFNSWGVHDTSDFGNIVFNLIEIGQMRKTDQDRKEDFKNIFDFDLELVKNFNIIPPE